MTSPYRRDTDVRACAEYAITAPVTKAKRAKTKGTRSSKEPDEVFASPPRASRSAINQESALCIGRKKENYRPSVSLQNIASQLATTDLTCVLSCDFSKLITQETGECLRSRSEGDLSCDQVNRSAWCGNKRHARRLSLQGSGGQVEHKPFRTMVVWQTVIHFGFTGS